MIVQNRKMGRSSLALAVAAAIGAAAVPNAQAYESPIHVFSINDIMGGFDGSTYGPAGADQDTSILCGVGGTTCPAGAAKPFTDRDGTTLYPIDSEFGFYVVDFVGAEAKTRDFDYMEGWAGNLGGGGVRISSSETDRYKVKPPLGTWCQGLGGNSVKCSTEHYTTMEHVLSCHETIPYFFADPSTGEQGTLSSGSLSVNCATTDLDDELLILDDGVITSDRLTDVTPGAQMDANDNTSVLDDIATSADYSVTLKDDGKPLYRWGGLIKRPNDIRMYARLELPDAWKAAGADYKVTKAHLIINHTITNNPNDQLRPEDLENEAASGRTPDYRVVTVADGEVWKSTKPCYEGDADFIDGVEGTDDATPLPAGTYFKNEPFALEPGAVPDAEPGADPYAFSEDLTEAFTNGYYTTIERDPFEWSYRKTGTVPTLFDFVGSPLPNDSLGTPVSGPRWRLKANKFGQDIPGLEIPKIECSPPPFSRDNIKYTVGEPVKTVINLLDWEAGEIGPLATSKGWVDLTVVPDLEVDGRCMLASNPNVTIVNVDSLCNVAGGEPPITSNGLPMTEDFDLAVYVKGDAKGVSVYDAYLEIEYEGGTEPPPTNVDVALSSLVSVPTKVPAGTSATITATVRNAGPAAASGSVQVTGTSNRGVNFGPFDGTFTALAVDQSQTFPFSWTAPTKPGSIRWTATVAATNDTNTANDTATLRTRISPAPK
jgi:hypothetical protein